MLLAQPSRLWHGAPQLRQLLLLQLLSNPLYNQHTGKECSTETENYPCKASPKPLTSDTGLRSFFSRCLALSCAKSCFMADASPERAALNTLPNHSAS